MSDVQRKHEAYMQEALLLAREAADRGDVPVGCIVVRNDEIVGRGYNAVQHASDPTLHAEIVAIRDAVDTCGEKFLEGATLYVTLEPCTMCAGAIVLARINTVVYGAAEPKTGAARSVFELLDDSRTNHQCVVRSGILEDECSALLTEFFQEQRAERSPQITAGKEEDNQHISRREGGMLYLVPTPIGNLSDITRRALDVLVKADAVYCEDTRHTGHLLRQYDIRTQQLCSNHDHNEKLRSFEIANRVAQGEVIAVVSDAGMPGMSDPGYRAVVACTERNLPVCALPGPCAAVTAVAASGLPTDRWLFAGFPPQKKGRATFLADIVAKRETVVLYESPYRIEKLLGELKGLAGSSRHVVLGRELSKLHEEYIRGSLEDVAAIIAQRGGVKGECVVVLEGARATPD